MSGISDILVKLMFTFCASSLDISEIVVVCNYFHIYWTRFDLQLRMGRWGISGVGGAMM
jgi:hypothetical protein